MKYAVYDFITMTLSAWVHNYTDLDRDIPDTSCVVIAGSCKLDEMYGWSADVPNCEHCLPPHECVHCNPHFRNASIGKFHCDKHNGADTWHTPRGQCLKCDDSIGAGPFPDKAQLRREEKAAAEMRMLYETSYGQGYADYVTGQLITGYTQERANLRAYTDGWDDAAMRKPPLYDINLNGTT